MFYKWQLDQPLQMCTELQIVTQLPNFVVIRTVAQLSAHIATQTMAQQLALLYLLWLIMRSKKYSGLNF